MSPFQANYGIEPRFGVELPTKGVTSASSSDVHAAKDFAKQMMTLHEQLRHEMTLAQAHYEKHASGRAPSPNYQIGDIVWLNAKNLRSERPSKKLDWKNLGPFKVIEVVNPRAFRLDLPPTMKIHNVFHTSLLNPVAKDPLPGQEMPPAPPQMVVRDSEEHEEYEVESIQDSRLFGKKKLL